MWPAIGLCVTVLLFLTSLLLGGGRPGVMVRRAKQRQELIDMMSKSPSTAHQAGIAELQAEQDADLAAIAAQRARSTSLLVLVFLRGRGQNMHVRLAVDAAPAERRRYWFRVVGRPLLGFGALGVAAVVLGLLWMRDSSDIPAAIVVLVVVLPLFLCSAVIVVTLSAWGVERYQPWLIERADARIAEWERQREENNARWDRQRAEEDARRERQRAASNARPDPS